MDAGLSISELAERAGVSRDTISNAEKGRHGLQATTLFKIARALNKTPSELLAEEERLSPKVSRRSLYEPSLFNGVGGGRRNQYRINARRLFLEADLDRWREEVETDVVRYHSGDVPLDQPELRRAWELTVWYGKLRHITELKDLGIIDEVFEALEEVPGPLGAFCREFLETAAFRAEEEKALVEEMMNTLSRTAEATATSPFVKQRTEQLDAEAREARATDERGRSETG